jgi:thiosulfate reductase/polysulfide reductase chain A
MLLRTQAVQPRYDTREGAVILKQLADRLGIGQYFPYNDMETLVRWQLEGTGFTVSDFEAKGFVAYGKRQIFWDRQNGLKFKTPSAKIEFKSALLENAGFESFPAYMLALTPLPDQFRLVTGRIALHTHVSTQNVEYLNELCGENVLWINSARAASLGIQNNAQVEVTSKCGSGQIKAFGPVHRGGFLLHGFGHKSQRATRSFNKGLSDSALQEKLYDRIGGSPAYHDTFVSVTAL